MVAKDGPEFCEKCIAGENRTNDGSARVSNDTKRSRPRQEEEKTRSREKKFDPAQPIPETTQTNEEQATENMGTWSVGRGPRHNEKIITNPL